MSPHLESQPGLDLVLQNLGNRSVEVGEDLHRQLRVDAVRRDEVIESVCQSGADAIQCEVYLLLAILRVWIVAWSSSVQCTCYGDTARSSSEHLKPSCRYVAGVRWRERWLLKGRRKLV